MENCKEYSPLSRDNLEKLRDKIAGLGFEITEDQEIIKGPFGIEFKLTYSEPEQKITICIVKKPMLVPEQTIWESIDKAISEYLNT